MKDGLWYRSVRKVGTAYFWLITRPLAHAKLSIAMETSMSMAKTYQIEIRQLKKAVARRNRRIKRLKAELSRGGI